MALSSFAAGLIKGAADMGTAGLQAVPAKLEEDLKEMGLLYNNAEKEFKTKMSAAQANIANIERIASDFGVEKGIVNSVYAANGGDESKTREQLKNMIDTYGDQEIPTLAIAPTKETTLTDQMQVDAAPKEAVETSMLSDFAGLFKQYGTEEAIKIFAKRRGVSVDRVKSMLSGTFGDLLPEVQYKVKPAPEAMLAALEKQDEKSIFSTDSPSGQMFLNVKTVINRVLSPDNQGQYKEGDVTFAQSAINNMITAMENDDAVSMALISGRVEKIVPISKPENAKIDLKWQTLSKNTETLLGSVINNKDITFDNAKILQLGNAQATAIESGKDKDWEKVEELYFDITQNKVIKQKTTEKKLSPYQKTINDLAVKHLEKSISKGVEYPAGKIEELSDALTHAQRNLDNDEAWQVVNLLVKNLKPTYPEEEKTLSAKEQVKSDMFYNSIITSPYYAELLSNAAGNEEKQKQIANEVRTKANEFAIMDAHILDGRLYAEDVVVGVDGQIKVFVKQINIGPGERSEPTDEIIKEINNNLNRNQTGLGDVSFLLGLLREFPNAYNAIGNARRFFGNISDIQATVTGYDLADRRMTGMLQDAEQRKTGFITNVKGRLFEDPRLSDQDLKLVLNFIGIINNNAIGSSAAQAALVGVERIFTTGIAIGLSDLMPNKTIIVKKDGGIDFDEDSIARDLLNKMVLASGISSTGKILTKEEFNNLTTQKEKDAYLTEFDILHKRASLAMEAIYAYRQDEKAYRKNFVTTGVSDIQ